MNSVFHTTHHHQGLRTLLLASFTENRMSHFCKMWCVECMMSLMSVCWNVIHISQQGLRSSHWLYMQFFKDNNFVCGVNSMYLNGSYFYCGVCCWHLCSFISFIVANFFRKIKCTFHQEFIWSYLAIAL